MTKYIVFLLTANLLCGCSSSLETFDCGENPGVGCKSISAVNKMVDQGVLGASEEEGSSIPLSVSLGEDKVVERIKEEHMRVWIAPFQDEHGNLHEGSIVHTVLKPGYWHVS